MWEKSSWSGLSRFRLCSWLPKRIYVLFRKTFSHPLCFPPTRKLFFKSSEVLHMEFTFFMPLGLIELRAQSNTNPFIKEFLSPERSWVRFGVENLSPSWKTGTVGFYPSDHHNPKSITPSNYIVVQKFEPHCCPKIRTTFHLTAKDKATVRFVLWHFQILHVP